ncbi:MAG: glycosyltransferase family 9 protein [Ignavibacteriales bacterium]|nr:glycosyltransferase family 9 protein [Ignavibacteriales bacterium]
MSEKSTSRFNDRFRKFLIIRTDRIGDLVLTLPLVHFIKTHFPDSQITMLIKEYTSDLVKTHPDIDNILFYDSNGIRKPLLSLLKSISQNNFDVVFHTHPRPVLAFITWLSRIPNRVGTGYRWYSIFFNRKIYEHRKNGTHHEMEYNLHLLRGIGLDVNDKEFRPHLPVHPAVRKNVDKILKENGISENDKIIILHPGSKGSSRDWSADNFGMLGNYLAKISNIKVVISGATGEENLVKHVQSIVGSQCVSLCNKFTLEEYGAFAQRAELFVSNSTGPIHIAAAVGTFVVGFYPQISHLSATRWGPYTTKKIIFTPRNKPPDCDLCFKKKIEKCECMDSIKVEEVLESIISVLHNNYENNYVGT